LWGEKLTLEKKESLNKARANDVSSERPKSPRWLVQGVERDLLIGRGEKGVLPELGLTNGEAKKKKRMIKIESWTMVKTDITLKGQQLRSRLVHGR